MGITLEWLEKRCLEAAPRKDNGGQPDAAGEGRYHWYHRHYGSRRAKRRPSPWGYGLPIPNFG